MEERARVDRILVNRLLGKVFCNPIMPLIVDQEEENNEKNAVVDRSTTKKKEK